VPSHVVVETKVVLTGAKSEDEQRNKFTAQTTSADLVKSYGVGKKLGFFNKTSAVLIH
jgi:hypothetical protein